MWLEGICDMSRCVELEQVTPFASRSRVKMHLGERDARDTTGTARDTNTTGRSEAVVHHSVISHAPVHTRLLSANMVV